MPVHHGAIHALGFVVHELLFERGMRRRVFRDDDEPGGVAIDSMHDQRSPATMRAKMAIEFLDDRRRLTAARQRHGQEPGRLVHDNQVVVFINDADLTRLARRWVALRASGTIHPHANPIAGVEASRRIADNRLVFVDEYLAPSDCLDRTRARTEPVGRREKFIQANARLARPHGPYGALHLRDYRRQRQLWPNLGLPES